MIRLNQLILILTVISSSNVRDRETVEKIDPIIFWVSWWLITLTLTWWLTYIILSLISTLADYIVGAYKKGVLEKCDNKRILKEITETWINWETKKAYAQHAVTVIAWFCEVLMSVTFNRPRFRLIVFVSEGRQIRQPLHVVHKLKRKTNRW